MKLDFLSDKLILTKDDGTKVVRLVKDVTTFEDAMLQYIASVDDATPEQTGSEIVLKEKLDSLTKEVEALKFKGADTPTQSDPAKPISYNNTAKDCVIKNVEIKAKETSVIKAKSILAEDVKLESSTIAFGATDSLKVSDLSLTGEYPSDRTGELVDDPVWVDNIPSVEVSGFKSEVESAWNGIFICHEQYTSAPSKVSISDCTFKNFKHNPIAIVSLAENGKATISNCKFDSCSFNNFRFSNFLDKSGISIDFINCEFCVIPGGDKTGAIYLRDIKSTAESGFNLFAPEKLTLNFYNCKVNGTPLTQVNCRIGTGDESQFIYVTQDKVNGFVPFDETKYPTVNIH